MKYLARKKVVFIIVEGPSDDTALGVTLTQVFDKDSVHVHIMHEDITTRTGVNPENIIAKIGNSVTKYARSNHYTPKDFKQIIHIVDTDGTYIPDEKVIEDRDCASIIYETDGIHIDNRGKVVTRNQQKRENLYRLRTCGKIWNVPYRIYYMSCNLDHVLYNKRNSVAALSA